MANITVTVTGQAFQYETMPVIASHGVNENYVYFTFDEEWDGYAKKATFYHELTPNDIYVSVVDGDDKAVMPHEVYEKPGKVYIGVTGVSGNVKLTSKVMPYPILPGSNDDGVNSEEPTPSIADQLMELVRAVEGSPLVANTAAGMTNINKIYVYTGSETGYVNGNWYYYDGSSWQSGGVYNSQAIGLAYQQEVAQMVKQSAVASESDSVPYLYRPTPNPSAILADEEIVGGTVAWNQLITPATGTVSNVSVTVSNGEYTFSGTASGSGGRTTHLSSTNLNGIAGHKVLMYTTFPLSIFNGIYLTMTGGSSTYMIFGGSDTSGMLIKEVPSTAEYYLGVNTMKGREYNDTGYINVMDLTAKLGSQIADYLYTLESGTAGAGVAKLKEWGFLSKDYFVYDAGTLKSVNTEGKEVTGKNIISNTASDGTASGVTFHKNEDGSWTLTGTASAAVGKRIGYTPIMVGVTYMISGAPEGASSSTFGYRYRIYVNGKAQSWAYVNQQRQSLGPYAEGTEQIEIELYIRNGANVTGKTYYPQLEIGTVATSYEPSRSTTYPTTPTDLNGIFKLDANNQLYADGDRYKADGTITRRYGIVDMGSLTWDYHSNGYLHTTVTGKALGNFNLLCARYITTTATTTGDMLDKEIKGNADSNANAIYVKDSAYTDGAIFKAAMNGVYLVYELATPTTDTADPYPATQIVGKGGTEQWIDQRSVPVPVGHRTQYYIGVPGVPANASALSLKATVTNGKTILSWS